MENIKRGKPPSVIADIILATILQYKNRVLIDNKIVSKTNIVWEEIASALDNKIKASSLYSKTVNNRHSIREKLFGIKYQPFTSPADFNKSIDTTLNSTVESVDAEGSKVFAFNITIEKIEFSQLLTETSYFLKNKNKCRVRKYTILQPKKWTELISKKIYDETRKKHGFHFKNHYIKRHSMTGTCSGK